ncbi:protein NETWORKED 3A-like [Hibiscus syriacus]|uniref:protein NETWORKED 3A-like n=1 Tax=Hibiscus syriacus TaxID=106335 RepID=UPI001921AE81|nr:protein NETWORKED 3A-like [Hibiscus syriacus]
MEDSNVTACNDMDTKINAILTIIVQDGDTFAKRAEMYYQKRPELIERVEELQRSYRSLAEKYDQLRSQGLQNYVQGHEELNRVHYSNLHPKFTAEDTDQEIEFNQDPSNSIKMKKVDKQKNIKFQRNISDGSLLMENEKLWNELRFKVSELVDDNASQQTEFIKRNDNGKTPELSDKVGKKTWFRLSWLKRVLCGRSMESYGT